MTDKSTEAAATTAKQIAAASQQEPELTMDDVAVCYKILTGLDPEEIVAEQRDELQNHRELQRIHNTKTSGTLMRRAVAIANAIDDYKERIIEEDAERVEAYVYGETQYCPDRGDLFRMLTQYGLLFAEVPRGWAQITFGGEDFQNPIYTEVLSPRIQWELDGMIKDAKKLGNVKRVQVVAFKDSPYCFVTFTKNTNVKYICYARRDWKEIEPVAA